MVFKSQKILSLLKGLLIAHFVVVLIHSAAHLYHKVLPDALGIAIIILGFFILPAFGLFKMASNGRNKMIACTAGLAVAFTYGVIYHFVLDTPDYVCYFGAHASGRWFKWSAYSIAVIDMSAFIIATSLLVSDRRIKSHLNIKS